MLWRLLEAVPASIKASIAIGKTSVTVVTVRERLVVYAQMLAYVASIAVLEACG